MIRRYVVLLVVAVCFCGPARAEDLTYVELIGRLTDLEGLAVLPQAGEGCAQWASYDRASKYDAATGEYVRWEANGDGDGLIRKEGENLVLAEMDGPGVIWRIWSAMPKEGHIKFFLDGAEKPAIDLPFIGMNVKAEFADRDDQIAGLRELALQMTWDDEQEPAVWSPLGDFLGSASRSPITSRFRHRLREPLKSIFPTTGRRSMRQ